MKKIYISILIICIIFTGCTYFISDIDNCNSDVTIQNSKEEDIVNSEIKDDEQEKIENKEYLIENELFKKSIEDKKIYLQNAFDHSKYNIDIITVIEEISVNRNIISEDKTSGLTLYFTSSDDKQLFLDLIDTDKIFYGKYTLYHDTYDFPGYDDGDKFVIYYKGNIPEDGDLSNCGLVTIIPEYQLIGSKAIGIKMGVTAIDENTKEIEKYLYTYNNIGYDTMSLEEAILKSLNANNINPEGFYREELSDGGFYYTNGEISVVGTASYCAYGVDSSKETVPNYFVEYEIKGYLESMENSNNYIFHNRFYNR